MAPTGTGASHKWKPSTSSLLHYKPRVPAVEPSSRRTILSKEARPAQVGTSLSRPPLSECYSISFKSTPVTSATWISSLSSLAVRSESEAVVDCLLKSRRDKSSNTSDALSAPSWTRAYLLSATAVAFHIVAPQRDCPVRRTECGTHSPLRTSAEIVAAEGSICGTMRALDGIRACGEPISVVSPWRRQPFESRT
jgi:hypothetical protein